MRMTGLRPAGLPHSDTAGSRAACASPAIFAACRVLHRLPEPRHPPCAFSFFRRRSCSPLTGYSPTAAEPRLCSHTAELGSRGASWSTCARLENLFITLRYRSGPQILENLLSFCSNMSMSYRGMTLRESFPQDVENDGFEPSTPCLQSRCSSQLS